MCVSLSCELPLSPRHFPANVASSPGAPLSSPAKTPSRRRLALILAGLGASSVAYAHYPHDVAHWMAVSPDPAQPRLVTSLERIDLDLLGRSENGLDWSARLVQATNDGEVVSAAFLTPMRLILAGGRGLQVSEDAGDTLVQESTVTDVDISRVVASPAVLVDGVAFAAGESAVWRTADAGLTWEAIWAGVGRGFTDVDVSPDFATDGRVCAAEHGAISCSHDGGVSWARTAIPAETYRISVGAEHRVWAVGRGEGLHVSADDGASWSLAGFEGEDLTAIAELSGGLVLMSKALQAEWRSEDGGATWSHVDVYQTVLDQSRDGVNFFDFVEGPDGAVYLACWPGLGRSDDRGLTYSFYNTERIEDSHSVVLTESGGQLAAWIGTYGGGPVLTDIQSLAAMDFPHLPVRFTRNTPTTLSWDRDGTAIFDEGYSTWRTTDWGATWVDIATDPVVDGEWQVAMDVKGVALAPDTSVDPFVLTTNGQTTMSFLTSEDLGDTWTTGTQDPACTTNGFAVALSPRWPDESRAWAACGGMIYESVDRGQSWTALGDTGASFVFRIVEQMDGALLVATSDGLWRMDAASTVQVAFDDALVVAVDASTEDGDDTVFALVPTQGWYRSDDGGDAWVELLAPTGDVSRMVSMSPTFAEDGTVAVAGYGGTWVSTDRGDSWSSIHALEVYEGFHDAWRTTGTWTEVRLDGASGGEVMFTDQVAATKTLDFRGIGVAVEAPATSASGVVAISLDGGRVGFRAGHPHGRRRGRPHVEASVPQEHDVVGVSREDCGVEVAVTQRQDVVRPQRVHDPCPVRTRLQHPRPVRGERAARHRAQRGPGDDQHPGPAPEARQDPPGVRRLLADERVGRQDLGVHPALVLRRRPCLGHQRGRERRPLGLLGADRPALRDLRARAQHRGAVPPHGDRGDDHDHAHCADADGQAPGRPRARGELPGAVAVGRDPTPLEPGEQVVGEGARTRVALLPVRPQGPRRDGHELGRGRGGAGFGGRRSVRPAGGRAHGRGRTSRWRGAGEELVEHCPERVDVCAAVQHVAAFLLGAHVAGGAAAPLGRLLVDRAGEPPVRDHGLTELAHHHVGGLEIAMEHAAPVCIGEGVRGAQHVSNEAYASGESRRLVNRVGQRAPGQHTHGVPGPPGRVSARGVDGDDVRVFEPRGEPGFPGEPGRASGV